MTFREAICYGEEKLNTAGIDDAKHDAWLLLTFICKIDRTFYYVHIDEEMSVEQIAEYESVLSKRAEHIPLQYITGEQVFMGIPFRVSDAVLIPRQDTETLVEEALKVIRPGMKVLDMCTGSGCILISILKNIVDVEGYGYDISKQAINLAKENNLSYAVDIYPMYGSDVSAALRAGNDIRGALIGPGVHASHGMERSHSDAVENTLKLLMAYICE